MAAVKPAENGGRGKRKQVMALVDIELALDGIDRARAQLFNVIRELKAEHIISIAFDGVGNAKRGQEAIGSYASALRGAITDPKCEKVYATKKKGS